MEKSISVLMDKKEELKQIREKNDAEFYLQVVPTLCVDESTPALAPSMTVILDSRKHDEQSRMHRPNGIILRSDHTKVM